jgi:hypothetical protein
MAIYAPTSTGIGTNHKKVASLVTVNLEELIDNDLSSITIDGTNYNINKNNLYNLSVELLNEIKNSNYGGTGGVIDGTLCTNEDGKDCITEYTKQSGSPLKIEYTVKNDCWLNIVANYTIIGRSDTFTVKLNDKILI